VELISVMNDQPIATATAGLNLRNLWRNAAVYFCNIAADGSGGNLKPLGEITAGHTVTEFVQISKNFTLTLMEHGNFHVSFPLLFLVS